MTERIAKPEHIAVAPGEPPIVDVQGLWTQFGKGDETFTVHQDLNFTVQRGEMLSLVGGSGTGKTVLLRQILGLARPTRGQVPVLGRPGSEVGRQGAASRGGITGRHGRRVWALQRGDRQRQRRERPRQDPAGAAAHRSARRAVASRACARFRNGRSIIRPSTTKAPRDGAWTAASTIRRASASSASEAAKAALASATCRGWMQVLPMKPSRRAMYASSR